MAIEDNTQTVSIRCEDNAEAVVFTQHNWGDGEIDYEITVEDSYCGGDFMGIKGRLKRAWHAFKAKPIFYTGIYCEDPARMEKFLKDCIALISDENENENETEVL